MKDGFVKVAAATPSIRVADTAHNAAAIMDMMAKAAVERAKILALPELCITGYTCGDLFLQKALLEDAIAALERIAEYSRGLDMLIFAGLPVEADGGLYNCAAAVYDGRLLGLVPKANLPNYGEFYEKRWFVPGGPKVREIVFGEFGSVPFGTDLLFRHAGLPELCLAAEICEDLWVPGPPSVRHAMAGATVIVNLSASNEVVTKDEYRRSLVIGQSARLYCGYIYSSAGDGESTTDLVFTGDRMICENGELLAESSDTEGIIFSELDLDRISGQRRRTGIFTGGGESYAAVFWGGELEDTSLTRHIPRMPFVPEDTVQRTARCEKILKLQSLGLKKRIEHSGADRMVLGVSGGLDSTLALLVCARTVDLLQMPRSSILAVTMPCFGTTQRTKSNAMLLAELLGADLRVVDISKSVLQHFEDIGHSYDDKNAVFENAQARERTQVLMDIANGENGIVVGTGDMSELALGWATYNGDHMSMYGVNSGVPKTLVWYLVAHAAGNYQDRELEKVLRDILDTPVSPELLPSEEGEISQKTEDIVGPYELHDFFLYYIVRRGYEPEKVLRLALYAFGEKYARETILKWLRTFIRRFFAQQFKRSCLPDGPKVGCLSLSPRGDWRQPSDASARLWLERLEKL